MATPAKDRRSRGGFTLMQMMIGIVWIGVLLTVASRVALPEARCRRDRPTKALLVCVAGQLDIFNLNHLRYPDRLEELIHAPTWLQDPATFPAEGYLREYPVDGWGNKLIYRRLNSLERPFVLLSLGADGREGGNGINADITY